MSDKTIYQAQAIPTKITTMSDNTLRIQLDCQELDSDEEAKILKSRNKLGWFAFAEQALNYEDLDIPEYAKEFKDEKTPSQRLRNVLYVLWEQKGKSGTSEEFYKRKMEEIINHFKDQLER